MKFREILCIFCFIVLVTKFSPRTYRYSHRQTFSKNSQIVFKTSKNMYKVKNWKSEFLWKQYTLITWTAETENTLSVLPTKYCPHKLYKCHLVLQILTHIKLCAVPCNRCLDLPIPKVLEKTYWQHHLSCNSPPQKKNGRHIFLQNSTKYKIAGNSVS